MAKKEQQQDIKRIFKKKGRQTGLAIVILAAVLLETIAAIQYYYTRNTLERNLEEQVLIMLRSSAMRLDGNLNAIVSQASNQTWHAQKRLDDPDYMENLVKNLVKNGRGRVRGAALAFIADYYPQKGRWFEPYAYWDADTVRVAQIGSAEHDYFKMEFFKGAIKGDTLKWTPPYLDEVGAGSEVITYSLPIRSAQGATVGVLGIDVTTNWIGDVLKEIQLHPSSFNLVFSEQGEVISSPADHSVCSPQMARKIAAMMGDPAVKKQEKSGGRVSSFKFYDDERKRSGRVYYARKKYQPQWTMAKVVHDDEAFADLAAIERNILWTSLAGLAALALIIRLFARNGRKLHATLLQQQRTDRELQIANGIQQALLPLDEPSLQGVAQVEVEGCLIPAREVGGDLYNVFVRDGKLFFCIGDVSGKGVPAALIMAVTQTVFHNVASEEDSPLHIMERLNVTACRNNKTDLYVTLFVGVLNLATGRLDYCNAGHEWPVLGGEPIHTTPNMPIGAFDDFSYQPEHTTMAPGDTLILYTDGLTEAFNAQEQQFGRPRAMQLMARCSGMKPKEIVSRLVSEVKQFAGPTEQSDDLTLLVIRYKP